jgi:hypothetical protein
VPVHAELIRRLAPAAPGVEECAQRRDQRDVLCRGTEHAIDEGLEGGVGEGEEQLERPQVAVGGDVAVCGVERGSRLDEAAAEAAPAGRAADGHPRKRLGLSHAAGEGEQLALSSGPYEERGAVAPSGGQVLDVLEVELLRNLLAEPLARESVTGNGEQGRVGPVGLEPERRHAPSSLAIVQAVLLQVFEQVAGQAELGGAHRSAPRQLEGQGGVAVVEHEPVVLAERLARPCRSKSRQLSPATTGSSSAPSNDSRLRACRSATTRPWSSTRARLQSR